MRKQIEFGGLSNSLDESVEANDKSWISANTQTDRGVVESMPYYEQIGVRSGASASDVGYGLGYGKWTGNEIQKLRVTGNPTGGTFKLEYDGPDSGAALNEITANLNWNCAAQDVQIALEDLTSLSPGDVFVTGGPFPSVPIYVEFTGTVANTAIRILELDTNGLTGGTTPSVEITTLRQGGDHEAFYAVVKHDGDTDANLYEITSTDGFETTTWTSLATDFHASDWFFQQFEDKVFMANATDGLKYVYVGTSTVSVDPPNPPTRPPTFGGPFRDDSYAIGWADGTYASSGFSSSPTLAASGPYLKCTLAATETGRRVTLTSTLSSDQDWSDNDWFGIMIRCHGGMKLDLQTIVFQLINADGSPVTIDPLAYTLRQSVEGAIETTYYVECQFAGNVRYQRDNVDKIQVVATISFGESADFMFIGGQHGSNWMNDTLGMGSTPVTDKSEYAMTYYRTSDGAESKLSPIGTGPTVPTGLTGAYISVNGYGDQSLSSSDLQWFYRREKSSGKWRRIPNLTTKDFGDLLPTDYGVANDPTGASDGQYDHWMEYELEEFPEPQNIGFPPTDTGAKAECIAAWKQSLIVGSGKLCYLSWVGQPLRFEPSPDQANYVAPDPEEFPDTGVTEYVSDNRADDVLGFAGQDSLYAVTGNAMYAKVGDTPAESTVFRRLPGSRGALGKRAFMRYGGGITVGSPDGLWYYSVGRGFSGEDNGALSEREETKPVRRSWDRLISPLVALKFTGNVTGGSFSISVDGEVLPALDWTATAQDVLDRLEQAANIVPGSIDVYGSFDAHLGGTVYVRFLGRYRNAAPPTLAVDVLGLEGDSPGVSVETVQTGGGSNLIVREFDDEYWVFNGKSVLFQSRERKWQEGLYADSVLEVVPVRGTGLFFLTSTGRMQRIGEGRLPANSGPLWYYESPWTVGQRLQITALRAHVVGNPHVRIYLDDGAGGRQFKDYTLNPFRFTNMDGVSRPGVRVKLAASGRMYRDAIKKLAVDVEPMPGDEYGS